MPPMFIKNITLIIGIIFVIPFALEAIPTAHAGTYGTHPYDTPARRSYRSSRSFQYRNAHLRNPYFRRTVTHALHPYYRNHYSDVLVGDRSGRRNIAKEIYLKGFPYYRIASAVQCSSYSYFRPNYRIPPSKFKCLRY